MAPKSAIRPTGIHIAEAVDSATNGTVTVLAIESLEGLYAFEINDEAADAITEAMAAIKEIIARQRN